MKHRRCGLFRNNWNIFSQDFSFKNKFIVCSLVNDEFVIFFGWFLKIRRENVLVFSKEYYVN